MKKRIRLVSILILIIFIAISISSCSLWNQNGTSGDKTQGNTQNSETPSPETSSGTGQNNGNGNPENDNTSLKKVNSLISKMTLEEKIGQLLFIAYRKDANDKNVLKMDSYLADILKRYKPGGFVLFSENLDSIDQTVSLIQGIQTQSAIPLFISIDEEGGIVTRLNKAPLLHSTIMPEAFTIGLTNKPEDAYAGAQVIAEELLSLGFNMDFAPVADIFTNPENKVIGKRAYGTEPVLAAAMVKEAVKGFCDQNIIPVLKHFPGHGDTVADTHTGAAAVQHDMDRLMTTELVPFKEGIEAGADAVMVAHILLPNVTKEPVPASLSEEIVTGILRNKLGFDGVVVTDALEMSAISSYYSDEEAAVKAVQAGVDMLLMPVSVEKTYMALLTAVHNGNLTEERIDESVRRILLLKDKYRILDNAIERPDPQKTLGSAEHEAVAEKIGKDAQTK